MNIKSILPALLLITSSCDSEAQMVEKQQSQYEVAQAIPVFDYSQERDIVIQLYEARNKNITTYTVWRSDMGTIEGFCPSIGYPIPYDTSLTNPLKRDGGGATVEQAEPNGLYPSKNSIATWVRCVVEVNGISTTVPIYVESKVTAYPWAIVVDWEKNRVTRAENALPQLHLTQR